MAFWKNSKEKENLKRRSKEEEKKKREKEDDKLLEWLEVEDELDELDKK